MEKNVQKKLGRYRIRVGGRDKNGIAFYEWADARVSLANQFPDAEAVSGMGEYQYARIDLPITTQFPRNFELDTRDLESVSKEYFGNMSVAQEHLRTSLSYLEEAKDKQEKILYAMRVVVQSALLKESIGSLTMEETMRNALETAEVTVQQMYDYIEMLSSDK